MFSHSPQANGLVVHQEALAPYWHHKTTGSLAGLTSSYYQQDDVTPIRGDRSLACTHNSCFVKAVLASLLAIVLLVLLCSSVQRKRKLSSSLLRRKLSDRSDSPSEGLSHCAGTDQETDSATDVSEETLTASSEDEETDTAESGGDSTASGSDEEAGPGAKRQRLEHEPSEGFEGPPGPSAPPSAGREEEAALALQAVAAPSRPTAAEGPAEVQEAPLDVSQHPPPQPEPAGDPSVPSPTGPQQEALPASLSPQMMPLDLSVRGGAAARPVEPSSFFRVREAPSPGETPLTGPSARTADELSAAQGLLLLQPAPPAAGPEIVHDVQMEQEGGPSILTSEHRAVAESTGPREAGGPPHPAMSPEPHPATPQEMGAEGILLDPGEGPSRPAGAPAPSVPPDKHPFAHVPTLKPGVTTRPFSEQRTRAEGLAFWKPYRMLADLRVLLLKETLDRQEAEMILSLVEQLMVHCRYYQTADVARIEPNCATRRLGIRFLILDTIVGGLKAVRQSPSNKFWEEFAAQVPHVFVSSTGPGQPSPFARYTELALRLSSALKTLMTGNLPPARERIELKETLFCSDRAPKKFQERCFDPWRTHCPDVSTGD